MRYKNITQEKLFIAMASTAALSKYWKQLPFVPNKGQALIATIKNLSNEYIYKFGHLSINSLEK